MALWEALSSMVYLGLVLLNVSSIVWTFYLFYFAISLSKLDAIGNFKRVDSQKTRQNVYQIYLLVLIV